MGVSWRVLLGGWPSLVVGVVSVRVGWFWSVVGGVGCVLVGEVSGSVGRWLVVLKIVLS